MIQSKYLQLLSNLINQSFPDKESKFFIFGSSLTKDHFGDIDLGVTGEVKDKNLSELKEILVNSTLPYFVDVVNFNKVSDTFKNNVFNANKILWIKR